MTKKRPPRGDAIDDDDFSDNADFIDAEDASLDFNEADVRELCGKQNAAKGSLLFANGAVTQRSFDGAAIHATVQDGASRLPVVFDLNEETTVCSDVNHARLRNPTCEHIAAALYAFIREPETFLPQTIGQFVQVMQQNPALRGQTGATGPQVDTILKTLASAPPDARAVLESLPLNPTPEDLARVAPQLQTLAADRRKAELKSLLHLLSAEDLRAIAKRREWILDSSAKESMIAQLALRLEATPLPAAFSPEEEQLARLVNTLEGVAFEPDRAWLERLWKKRAGGDLRRLDQAVRGLQSAGAFFPCTREGSSLHYHWSPFVRPADLPLLAPKIKLYPTEKIERLQPAESVLPLAPIFDAVIEFAEREPLRVNPKPRDPRLVRLPYLRDWDYLPQEVEQLTKFGYFQGGALTIPFTPFWADETRKTLEAFAGGARDLGSWVAAMAVTLGILQTESAGGTMIVPEKLQAWRAQTSESQQRAVWESWHLGAIGFNELRMASERASLTVQRVIHDESFAPMDLTAEMGYARQFVARLLAPLDPLTWFSWKSFTEYARDLRGDFLHTFTTNNTWFLVAAKTHHRYDPNNARHWDEAYRPILAAMFEGALRWLGAVELRYEGNNLAAFHITPLGAWLLSDGKAPSAAFPLPDMGSGGKTIDWLDEATCRLRATPDAARVMPFLRAFADPTREPLTFRVSNASIARAFERGATAASLTEQFAAVNAPLPDALRERLAALEGNYGRAHLYERLTVLELSDDFALRELMAGTSLGKYIVHQFSPRLVVVQDDHVDELVNELVKKGYTPRTMTNDETVKYG